MRIPSIALAMVVAFSFFASNPSETEAASKGACTKQTIECPPFVADESPAHDMGRVISLHVSFGAYEVQVLTAGGAITLTVPKDLWDRLDVGDIVIQDSGTLILVRKGQDSNGEDRTQ